MSSPTPPRWRQLSMSAARAVKNGDLAEARRLRAASRAARLAELIGAELPAADVVDAWATEIADGLRPLSSTEAAAVGHLVAVLDRRIADGGPDAAA